MYNPLYTTNISEMNTAYSVHVMMLLQSIVLPAVLVKWEYTCCLTGAGARVWCKLMALSEATRRWKLLLLGSLVTVNHVTNNSLVISLVNPPKLKAWVVSINLTPQFDKAPLYGFFEASLHEIGGPAAIFDNRCLFYLRGEAKSCKVCKNGTVRNPTTMIGCNIVNSFQQLISINTKSSKGWNPHRNQQFCLRMDSVMRLKAGLNHCWLLFPIKPLL